MPLPIIAIVGRPNVGKSRLFNRLAGKFKALVDDTSGVTRDRHYSQADWRGKSFIIVDTGGLIPGSEDPLNKKVWHQAFLAIGEADVIVCVLDGQQGVTPVDEILVEELRRMAKPCLYAVNKVDVTSQEKMVFDFSGLGVDPLIPVSAEHGRGVSDLLEAIHPYLEKLQSPKPEIEREAFCRLAIAGRPNVGKSTLINHLAREERVIVHEEAGTTRDPIDVILEKGGRPYLFVDTAGIKKKSATKGRLEKFSVVTTLKAIDRAEIVLLLCDATQGVTHQDLSLAYYVWNEGKGLLLLLNKWDLMKSAPPEKYLDDVRWRLGELQSLPILPLSAKTGKGCQAIWEWIDTIQANRGKRIETRQLNDWMEEICQTKPPPAYKGKEVRIYYGTQVRKEPPHFVFFVNEPKGIPVSYARFLKHQLTETFELQGAPVILSFRPRREKR